MKISPTQIDGLLVIEPDVHEDGRGFFMESYHKAKFKDLGIACEFVQDNHSGSVKNTLRGLHYQSPCPQDKMVRAVSGEIFDVAVDIRHGSKTFGRWDAVVLSASNRKMLYIPKGFAHGFCVLSDYAEICYKCSDFYRPEYDRGIRWDDPDLAIAWPVASPILSKRDSSHPSLRDSGLGA